MNEDKKEFLFLGEEDRKLLGEARIVYLNSVAPNATQVVVVNTDPSVVKSVLDKLHWLWPAGDAQGRKQEAGQGAGQATGPENHPAEGPVAGWRTMCWIRIRRLHWCTWWMCSVPS